MQETAATSHGSLSTLVNANDCAQLLTTDLLAPHPLLQHVCCSRAHVLIENMRRFMEMRRILRYSTLFAALAVCCGAFTSSLGASGGSGGTTTTQSSIWMGTLGGNSSQAYGVSSNGSV